MSLTQRQEQSQRVPEWTRECVFAVAAFMGYGVVRSNDQMVDAVRVPFPLLFEESDGTLALARHVMDPPKRWNPFTDANADLQVLERAREMWSDKREETIMDDALETLWLPSPWTFSMSYSVGDYSRAVLAVMAVLRSAENKP